MSLQNLSKAGSKFAHAFVGCPNIRVNASSHYRAAVRVRTATARPFCGTLPKRWWPWSHCLQILLGCAILASSWSEHRQFFDRCVASGCSHWMVGHHYYRNDRRGRFGGMVLLIRRSWAWNDGCPLKWFRGRFVRPKRSKANEPKEMWRSFNSRRGETQILLVLCFTYLRIVIAFHKRPCNVIHV